MKEYFTFGQILSRLGHIGNGGGQTTCGFTSIPESE